MYDNEGYKEFSQSFENDFSSYRTENDLFCMISTDVISFLHYNASRNSLMINCIQIEKSNIYLKISEIILDK